MSGALVGVYEGEGCRTAARVAKDKDLPYLFYRTSSCAAPASPGMDPWHPYPRLRRLVDAASSLQEDVVRAQVLHEARPQHHL